MLTTLTIQGNDSHEYSLNNTPLDPIAITNSGRVAHDQVDCVSSLLKFPNNIIPVKIIMFPGYDKTLNY